MKVLIITDEQKDFIDGSLANPSAEKMVVNTCKHLTKNKGNYDFVVVTQDTHFEDYLTTNEGKHLPVVHTVKGTPGWKVDQRIIDTLNECGYKWEYLEKNTFGYGAWAKYFVYLADFLDKTDEPLEVDICGTVTDICVITNTLLIKTALPDATVRVFADLCAGLTPEKHESALSVMESCQVEVIR